MVAVVRITTVRLHVDKHDVKDPEHLRGEETMVACDRTYRGARSKLVTIKGISRRASVCPVAVTGMPEAVRGSGFGTLL
jgi:hypothetical protein